MAEDELEWRCHKRSRYFFSTFFHSSTLTEQEIADELETKQLETKVCVAVFKGEKRKVRLFKNTIKL